MKLAMTSIPTTVWLDLYYAQYMITFAKLTFVLIQTLILVSLKAVA
jgi:hypothetical protein